MKGKFARCEETYSKTVGLQWLAGAAIISSAKSNIHFMNDSFVRTNVQVILLVYNFPLRHPHTNAGENDSRFRCII